MEDVAQTYKLSKLHLAVLCDADTTQLEGLATSDTLRAQDVEGSTPLHLAAIMGRCNAVKWLLSQQHVPSMLRDSLGNTPLHLAVAREHGEIVDLLLAHSHLPLCARDNKGRTPLHLAVSNDHPDILDVLIRHGADPHIRDNWGNTPLHYAVTTDRCAFVGRLCAHTDVNCQNYDGLTPLHLAVESEHAEVVRLLLRQQRIDPNTRTYKSLTPLHVAVKHDLSDIVQHLLSHPSIDVNAHACHNYTPLHVACMNGHVDMVRALLQRSMVEINARAWQDGTPLKLAIEYGSDGCVVELLLAGADCCDLDAQESESTSRALQGEIARLMEATVEKRSLRRQIARMSLKTEVGGCYRCCAPESPLEEVRRLRRLQDAEDVTRGMQDVLVHAIGFMRR